MNNILKYFSYLVLAAIGLFVFGCNGDSKYKNYDKGYEAGWEGERAPSSRGTSKEEKEGYQDGLADAFDYDEGYCDGIDGRKPKYPKEYFYMDGYKNGKKDKRY